MQKRKASKRVVFRANEQDQRNICELMRRLVEKRLSEILRLALKELLRRVKRRAA